MSSLLRAPEIALGLPFTEAIDVWGVGCILAFLYLADNLFPVNCDYQMVGQIPWTNVQNQEETLSRMSADVICIFCLQMKSMVEVLGQLEDHLLCAGKYTQYFFIEEEAADGPTWRMMVE